MKVITGLEQPQYKWSCRHFQWSMLNVCEAHMHGCMGSMLKLGDLGMCPLDI